MTKSTKIFWATLFLISGMYAPFKLKHDKISTILFVSIFLLIISFFLFKSAFKKKEDKNTRTHE